MWEGKGSVEEIIEKSGFKNKMTDIDALEGIN